MRVLILGCGYVGERLAKRLADQAHTVFGATRSGASADALKNLGVQSITMDITRAETFAALPEVDAVVDAVSSNRGGEESYREVFLDGTKNLLMWLHGATSVRQVIFVSSTSVYAQNDGFPIDESSPAEPTSATGKILREAEALFLSASSPPVRTVLRAAGIYGPGRGHLFHQFLRGEARIRGDGSRMLNMIHVEDLAGALAAALSKPANGIFNAVDDQPVSEHDFFSWLAEKIDRPFPSTGGDAPISRKRGVTNKQVSNKKLKEQMDYRFEYPTFREGYSAEIDSLNAGARITG